MKVHITQKVGYFSVQLLVIFFLNLDEIKETYKIQAKGIPERVKCFSATTDRQKY